MAAALNQYRLVYVGPADGETAVGDYAEDFIKAVRPHFGEVAERRTPGPGGDGVRDILGHRRAVAELVRQGPPGRVLVHAELAGGGISPFWSIAGLRDVPVSATIHDPPQGVWWPARTRFLSEHRLLNHGIHYPLRSLSRAIEGAVYRERSLFVMSEIGRRSIEQRYPHLHPIHVPFLVRDRPVIRPAQERPKAIGFFGLVYRGKGFEQIARIREGLPDDILIRVAGRGTESLPRADGIDIIGPVDGPDEDAFFESIRALVVPYGKRHWQDETYPASGTVAHAMAYRTPVVCTGYGSLAELDEKTGTLVVLPEGNEKDAVATSLVAAISSLLNDRARLTELGEHSEKTRQARSGPRIAEAFVAAWSALLERESRDF
jgi:glycosyltransferase involved in cell wall biosynthesis